MPTVPYGCISGPCQILAEMLAACPAFQLWVEATDEDLPADEPARSAACLSYIHFGTYERPDSGYVYPAAIIEVPNAVGFEAIGQGAAGGVFDTGSGTLTLAIYWAVPSELADERESAWIEFSGVEEDGEKRGIGAIVEQMTGLSEEVVKFEQYSIDVVEGPMFLEPKVKAKLGLVLACGLMVKWGVGG